MDRRKIIFGLIFLLCFSAAACSLPVKVQEPKNVATLPSLPEITPTIPLDQMGYVTPQPGETLAVEAEATQIPVATLEQASKLVRIVWIEKGDIYAWDSSAGKQIVATGMHAVQVRLSEDGQQVSFLSEVTDTTFELRAINTDGSGLQTLLTVDDLNSLKKADSVGISVRNFSWVPGADALTFSTVQITPDFWIPDDNLVIVAVPPSGNLTKSRPLSFLSQAGSTPARKILLPAGQGGYAVSSSSGEKIAVIKPDSVNLMNLDGSGFQSILKFSPVITYSEMAFYPEPKWSSDSQRLLVAIPPQDPLNAPGETVVWEIAASDGALRKIASFSARMLNEQGVHFSPDLTHLAYLKSVGDQVELHVAKVDGSDDVVYVSAVENAGFSGWAADSSRFAYWDGQPTQVKIGQIGRAVTSSTAIDGAAGFRWVGSESYLFLNGKPGEWQLNLASIGKQAVPLGNPVSMADFDISSLP